MPLNWCSGQRRRSLQMAMPFYEILKQVPDRQVGTETKVDEPKAEMRAFHGHLVAMPQDIR